VKGEGGWKRWCPELLQRCVLLLADNVVVRYVEAKIVELVVL